MKNLNEIIEALKKEEWRYIGLRCNNNNPITGKKPSVKIGDVLDNSFEWDDGNPTEEELNGTCAIDTFENPEYAFSLVKTYNRNHNEIMIIGSDNAEYGFEEEELIMKDAVVLAIIQEEHKKKLTGITNRKQNTQEEVQLSNTIFRLATWLISEAKVLDELNSAFDEEEISFEKADQIYHWKLKDLQEKLSIVGMVTLQEAKDEAQDAE